MANITFQNIGQKVFLNSQLGIFGKLNITSLSFNSDGETLDRLLLKKFRYSFDNLEWSEWIDLNLSNLQQINNTNCEVLFINFWLERQGSDTTGIIEFMDISIDGDIIVKINDFSTTQESIFKDLVNNDTLTVSVANNLLKKIYQKGIIPNYIQRGFSYNNEDFISFWSSICTYFSYVIGLANKFDNILNEKELLSLYLEQRGVEFCKDEITLSDLQYIANNFFDEIRKRGTKFIFLDKDFKFLDNSSPGVDGEWLRLICKNHYDEFLVEFVKNEHCGFFIDKSSNLYNGTNLSTQLNKTKENSEDFVDLSKYRLINEETPAYEIESLGYVDGALSISPDQYEEMTSQDVFGIGYGLDEIPLEMDLNHLINVDVDIDYELTFKIKKGNMNSNPNIKVGINGCNVNGWVENNCFQDYITNIPKNIFCSKNLQTICKTDNWYFLRFIIYSLKSKQQILKSGENDWGITKLKFSTEISKIIPFIHIDSVSPNDKVYIHDLKFRPLIRGKNSLEKNVDGQTVKPYFYNPCFIQNNNSAISWFKNNSDKRDIYVENFINNYLLQYHKNLFWIDLKPKTNDKQLLT